MTALRAILLSLFAAMNVALSAAEPPVGRAVPGEVLVKFQPAASAKQRRAVLNMHGARVIRHFENVDLDHLALPEGADVNAVVASLLISGDVILAQPNYIRHITADQPPNDPYWIQNAMWGLFKVQAQPAWQQFGGGDGSIVLAGLDTGVSYNHPDLAANIWTNPNEIPGNGIDDDANGYIDDVHGIDTAYHDSNPMDDHGHGTHTAGTMAAIGNNNLGVVGVSWNAKIIVCKCFNSAGNGADADITECLNYLIALKQRGVNLRASNNSYNGGLAPGEPFPSALKAAFDAAAAAGILNVCSAGNDHANSDAVFSYPTSFDSPGILVVAGSDGSDNRADFSNYGAVSVDLAAPGPGILSTFGADYGYLSGTSMSAPHVAGAVALLAQLNPAASVATIKSLLMNNVDVLPQWNGLSVTSGRLNVFKAAQAAAASTQPIFVTALNRPAAGEMELTWTAVAGVRYQVRAAESLTSDLAPLGDVIVAGVGQTSLTFTDSSATGTQKYYQVQVVP